MTAQTELQAQSTELEAENHRLTQEVQTALDNSGEQTRRLELLSEMSGQLGQAGNADE